MNYKIEQVAKAYKEYETELKSDIENKAEHLKQKYLGKKGLIPQMVKEIGKAAENQRATLGKEIHQLSQYIQDTISQLEYSLDNEIAPQSQIDPTAPFDVNSNISKRPKLLSERGHRHPLMTEMENILSIFQSMGFAVEEAPQLDDDYHMFEALNIPKGHPARDMWDTFWTDEGLVPPAHTSTMQNRVLKMYKPPIRVVMPGRCYRNEATDANHEHTFYQIEGVYVDKGISMGHMLATIKTYLEKFFNKELEIQVRPAYFPFVEPAAEYAISCPFCNKTKCPICGHKGWMEVMGCGMIHPFVLREGGLDPEVYTGFAWGFGLDRLVLLKQGIKDIRRFHSGDMEFLKQF